MLSLANRSGSTRNNHLSSLRSVFAVIRITAGLDKNVWDAIPRVEKQCISRNTLTLEQVQKIYKTSFKFQSRWPEFWPTAIMLGFHTGLRFGYVCTLLWEEIDFENKILNIKQIKNSDRKSNKELQFPIPDELLKHFVDLKDGNIRGYVWPKVAQAKLSKQGHLFKEFKEICEQSGIQTSRKSLPGESRQGNITLVGFHSLRHTYITLAKDAGADIADIQKAVGHGSPKMTNQYNQSLEYAKRIAEKLPKLTEEKKRK